MSRNPNEENTDSSKPKTGIITGNKSEGNEEDRGSAHEDDRSSRKRDSKEKIKVSDDKEKPSKNFLFGFLKRMKGQDKGKRENDKESVEEPREPTSGRPSEYETQDIDKYEALVIVPPDGGWGWVIVACCFLILMCGDGSMISYGAFSFHIEEEFKVNVAETSAVSSISTCLYYVCVEGGRYQLKKSTEYPYKFRRTGSSGPVWGALGNRYGFRVVIMTGAALMAMGNFSAFFIDSSFFPFAVCYAFGVGTGGGMIFMASCVMVGVYFERWRGYAIAIVSCGSSLGAVFMPPAYNAITSYMGWRYILVLNGSLLSICILLGLLLRPLKPTLLSRTPEPRSVQFKDSLTRRTMERRAKAASKTVNKTATQSYPTASENLQSSSFVTLKGVGVGGSSTSIYMSTAEGRSPPTPPTEEQLDEAGARPMYRDDIFYPASIARLGSQLDSQSVTRMSIFSSIRLPAVQDVTEERIAGKTCRCCSCTCCPPGVRRVLATLLDVSLLRSPVFMAIAITQTICMLGYHAPFLFTTARARDSGMNKDNVDWLLPLMGIANTIGRLLSGAIVELPGVSALHLTNVSFAVGGIFSICSCFNMGYHLQYAYVCVFGLMAAAFMAMKSLILVDYLGIERLTNAFGLLLMFQGVASLCGPPLAGFVADSTHSFNSAFFCAGSIAVVGGLSGFVLIPLKKYELRRAMNG